MNVADMSVQRWRLTREDLIRIALASVIIGLLYVIYHFLGNEEPNIDQRSTLKWMVFRWQTGRRTYGLVYYLFAVLVPLTSAALVWRRRTAIQHAAKQVNWLGWGVIVVSLLAHWVGVKTEHPRLSLLSLIGILWGIPFFLFGWRVAREIIFPAAFLVFCIPLNFLDSLVFRMRVLISRTAAVLLNGLGVGCNSEGSSITEAVDGGFVLHLQGASAGLATLLLCLAFAAALGNVSQRTWVRQWLVFLAAIPAYALANVLVVTFLGLLAGAFGQGLVDWCTAHLLTGCVLLMSLFGIVGVSVVARRISLAAGPVPG